MGQQEITTILGVDASFDGKLTFSGALRIDGRFRGEIVSEGTLVIGQQATVEANITTGALIVQGTLRGDVSSTGTVEIRAPARMFGNLNVASLLVEPGSVFEGHCKMGAEKSAAVKPPPIPAAG